MRDAGARRARPRAARDGAPRDVCVGDDDDAVLAQHRPHQRAGLLEQARADDDVVAARAELDAQALVRAHDGTAATPR